MKLSKIIESLEKWAPPIYQEHYDNSGLMVGDQDAIISGCIISLDCTEKIVDEAIKKKYAKKEMLLKANMDTITKSYEMATEWAEKQDLKLVTV